MRPAVSANADKDNTLSKQNPAILDELLQGCANRDKAAFARLYRLTSAKLFALAVRILKEQSIAEECLQEAYIRIWQQAGRFDAKRAGAMTWMVTIVRHGAIDMLRRGERRYEQQHVDIADDLMEATSAASASNDPLQQVHFGDIQRCMETLKEQQRDCLGLAYFEGLTHEEVANRMALPMGTVKTWIRRGLAQLKQCLE
jgi:RNA polymerase sigma-70 factor (ECF subfamily)